VTEWRQHLLGDVQANATAASALVQEAVRKGFDAETLDLLRKRMEERQGFVRYRTRSCWAPEGNW
jgi:hypothetical protein